ncbi:hypothetical protein CHLRE_02g074100v5 [Chlamydomonas reinhardtii]|uniref:Uncharacterized protein n=1 Tax=Chlamydomonas reinhardtii TaxID=3055 RepID=A0A2K3E004_CHLRE|nr:uncharacterized protein CHLRE_02g074100v5 [Chlamydomonas reinhardtii]PNW86120.1 hypothetical protein CHLRE_02g074100v5 [Chlamydomonas reinhardtii]
MNRLTSKPSVASRSAFGTARPVVAPRVRVERVVVRAQAPEAAEAQAVNSNVCSTCGADKSKMPGGCDGQGRVIGGMGALPGFGWWPIKAYKPCPALNEAGLEYTRKGQMTNDVLFGGVSLGAQGAQSLEEIKKQADKGIKIN